MAPSAARTPSKAPGPWCGVSSVSTPLATSSRNRLESPRLLTRRTSARRPSRLRSTRPPTAVVAQHQPHRATGGDVVEIAVDGARVGAIRAEQEQSPVAAPPGQPVRLLAAVGHPLQAGAIGLHQVHLNVHAAAGRDGERQPVVGLVGRPRHRLHRIVERGDLTRDSRRRPARSRSAAARSGSTRTRRACRPARTTATPAKPTRAMAATVVSRSSGCGATAPCADAASGPVVSMATASAAAGRRGARMTGARHPGWLSAPQRARSRA